MIASKWIKAGLMVAVATPLAAALAAGTAGDPVGEDREVLLRAPVVMHPAPHEAPPQHMEGLSRTMAGGLTVATGVQYAADGAPVFFSAGPVPWSAEWFHVCEASYTSFDPETGTYLGKDGKRHFCQ